MRTKFVKLPLLLVGICVLSVAPVFADSTTTITSITFLSHGLGNIGAADLFREGPFTLGVSGFERFGTRAFLADLFAKNVGPSEMGLGLADGVDHEINGDFFIQLTLRNILAASPSGLSLSLSSLQGSDAYDIWGSATGCGNPCLLGTLLASNQTGTTFTITDRSFPIISITAAGFSPTDTVLLEDVDVTTTTHTPEPSSAALLLIGFGALVAAGFTLGKKLIA